MTGEIFISYRREDSAGTTGRLYDRLAKTFSRKKLFMDVDERMHGLDFVKVLDAKVGSCGVLLAIIGPDWLGSADSDGRRRLDNAGDFVRIELASALRRDIPVIPVLIDGAAMPEADELPDDLKALARRHAVELRNARFNADSDLVVAAIRARLKGNKAGWSLGLIGGGTAAAIAVLGVIAYNIVVPTLLTSRQPSAPFVGKVSPSPAENDEKTKVGANQIADLQAALKAKIAAAAKAMRDADDRAARKAEEEAQARADAVRKRLAASTTEANDPACLAAPSDSPEIVIRTCSIFISRDPERRMLARALNRRGLAYARTHLHSEALADFNRLLEIDKTNSGYFDNRQSVYRALKQYELALRDATETIRLSPDVAFGYHSRGNLYYDIGRYEDAISDLTRASTAKNAFIWSIHDRGRAYVKLERFDLAVQDFTSVIEKDPNATWAYRERAFANIVTGALDKARTDLQVFLRVSPNEAGALLALEIIGAGR